MNYSQATLEKLTDADLQALDAGRLEDMSDEGLQALDGDKTQPQVNVGTDVAKSAGAGGLSGLAMLTDALNPANMARDLWGNTKALVTGDFSTAAPVRGPSTMAADAADKVYTPKTKPGQYAYRGTQGAVASLPFGGAGVVTGAVGGVGGQAGGDATADVLGEDYREYGDVLGSVLSALGGGKVMNRMAEPGRVDAARNASQKSKEAAYKVVDESTERVSRPGTQRFVRDARQQLAREGYVDGAPEYASITRKLDELANKPSDNLTPAGFDAYLKGLDNIAGSSTNEGAGLAKSLKRKTMSFLDDVDSPSIRAARKANSQWEAFKLADDIEGNVTRRAPSTTPQTEARNQLRNIANDADQMNYLSPSQRAAVQKGATTTTAERALRTGAKLAPTRLLGFGAAGGAAGTAAAGAFNPAFLIPNGIGILSELGYRGLVNRSTGKAMRELRGMKAPANRGAGGGAAAAAGGYTDKERESLRNKFGALAGATK